MTDGGDSTEAFDAIVASVPTPFYVVTTAAGGERAGCLVGYASRCSIDPPRFAVWLSKVNHTYRIAVGGAARSSCTSCAPGTTSSPHCSAGRPATTSTSSPASTGSPVPTAAPVLGGLDWFAGAILDRVDTGDHVAFVLAPFGGRCVRASADPLPDSARRRHRGRASVRSAERLA